MADLATSLNNVQIDPQAGQSAPPAAPKSWWQSMGDYIGGTNWDDLGKAFLRIHPATQLLMAADDINKADKANPDQPVSETLQQGLAPQRFVAAQGAHLPTDIVSGGISLYPFGVGLVNQLSGMAGGPQVDVGQGAVADLAQRVKESSTPLVDALAGRSSTSDDLLRGGDLEMAGHLSRTIGGFTPLGIPGLGALSRISTGSKYLDAAGNTLKNIIETVTPLSISASPTMSMVARNAAFGTVAPVLFEGAAHVDEDRKEAARLSGAPPFTGTQATSNTSDQATAGTQGPNTLAPSQLDKPAAASDGVAAQAHSTMASGVDVAKPKLAMAVPSTGSDWGDAALLAVGAAGLFGLFRRDLAKNAADRTGATKLTTSYDPANPLEATNMPLGTMLKQQNLDRSASLSEVMSRVEKETGSTASQTRETVREWEESLSKKQGASVNVRANTFMTKGEFMDNPNFTLNRPYNDHAVEVAQGITPDQREAYNTVLHYKNEMDNREAALKREFHTPGSRNYDPTMTLANDPLQAIATNLYDIPTRDLQAGIRRGMSDPVVARLTNEYFSVNGKLGQYMAAEGRLHPTEVAQFQRTHPNYVPPNDPGSTSFINPPKDISNQTFSTNAVTGVKTPIRNAYEPTGFRTMKELGDPLVLQSRYIDEVFRSTEGKKGQRDFINYLQTKAAQGSQVAKDMLGRARTSNAADYKVVQWRDRYGNLRRTEINDAVVRDSLKGLTNPTALQMTRGHMATLTNWLESGAVGPLSLVGGQTFPLRSAMYSVTGGTVLERPPGISMGWADRGVRNLTGALLGKDRAFGVRGDFYTMAPDALLYRAPVNVAAVTAGHLGNALHNAVLKNSFIARAMTPMRAQQFATALKNHYLNSALAAEGPRGLTGPSSMESMTRSNVYEDPAQAFRAQGKLALSYHYVRDVMHAISAAPAQSLRAMNKGVPEWKVDSAIRNLSGDVGRSGAFRKPGGEPGVSIGGHLTRWTPWGNTYLQSGAKTLGSFDFKNNPAEAARVVGGIMQSIVIPSGMLSLWAAALGPQYAKYMYHDDTPEKRASSWYVPIPGHAPNEAWRPTLEPWMRPFKLLGEVLAGHMIGAYSGELYKDENAEIRKTIGEAVFHRDHSLDPDSMMNVLFHQVIAPPVMPAISVPASLMGVEVRGYGDVKMPQPANRKAGYTEGTGKDPTGNFLGLSNQEWMDTFAQSIGATGAQAVLDYYREASHWMHLGAGPQETVERIGQVANQRFGDSLDAVGSAPLLDRARGIVPSHAGVSILARDKANGMNTISNEYNATMSQGIPRGDVTGDKKRGFVPTLGPGPPPPPDQETADFSSQVKRMNSALAPYRTQVNDLYENLNRIKNNYAYSPQERRARGEVVAYQIIDANKRILADMRRYETILSQRFGRDITFDTYRPGVSILQQYKPLAP